jgi:hypothetical protein
MSWSEPNSSLDNSDLVKKGSEFMILDHTLDLAENWPRVKLRPKSMSLDLEFCGVFTEGLLSLAVTY